MSFFFFFNWFLFLFLFSFELLVSFLFLFFSVCLFFFVSFFFFLDGVLDIADGQRMNHARRIYPKSRGHKEHQGIDAREQRETACKIFRRGWMISQKISRTQKCQHPQPSLMTQIRNVLQTWHQGSSVLLLTSRKTQIEKSASEPIL